jgi:TctA family transporter
MKEKSFVIEAISSLIIIILNFITAVYLFNLKIAPAIILIGIFLTSYSLWRFAFPFVQTLLGVIFVEEKESEREENEESK